MNKFGFTRLYRDNISVFHKLYFLLFGVSPDHQLRYLYLKYATNKILSQNNINRILDAGCGTGDYSFYLSERFPYSQVTGIDIDNNVIKCNNNMLLKLNVNNVKFECQSITALPDSIKYDLICCIDVLEHITDINEAVERLVRSLDDEGYIYIHLPLKKRRPVILNDYLHDFHEWEKDEHIGVALSVEELLDVVTNNGLEVCHIRESFNHYLGEFCVSLIMLFYKNSIVNNIVKTVLAPLLIVLTYLDARIINKSGNAVSLLVKKYRHS